MYYEEVSKKINLDDMVCIKYDTHIPRETESVYIHNGMPTRFHGTIIDEYVGFVYSIDTRGIVISQKHPKFVTWLSSKKRLKMDRIKEIDTLIQTGSSLEKQLSS